MRKYGSTGLICEKPEALYAKLRERQEAFTNSYFKTGHFLEYTYSLLVAKDHEKILSRCLVLEFSLQGSYIEEKLFVAASVLFECDYLLLL